MGEASNRSRVQIPSSPFNITNFNITKLDIDNIEPITVWIPKNIELNFGVGSDIMVMTQKSISTDKEGNTVNNYNGLGVYVLVNTGPVNKPKPITYTSEESKTEEKKPEQDSSPVKTPESVAPVSGTSQGDVWTPVGGN